jgi:uncharacterized membrane protein (DUF106 family)
MIDFISLIQASPKISIIVIGILVSFFITLVNYFVLDQDKMKELKVKQKTLNDEMKKHKDNPNKLMELQKEMLSHASENMRHSFKPMLITFIPIIFIFAFLRKELALTTIASSWIWYYIVSSIIASIAFRKLFKMP